MIIASWSCWNYAILFHVYHTARVRQDEINVEYPLYERSKEFGIPPGRPNILYFMPEQSGGRSFRFPVNEMNINACHLLCELPNVNGCTKEIHELAKLIMREEELEFFSNTKRDKIFLFPLTTLILIEYIIWTHWFW